MRCDRGQAARWIAQRSRSAHNCSKTATQRKLPSSRIAPQDAPTSILIGLVRTSRRNVGIGIVLIVYFIALSIAAVISSGILLALTFWYLRGVQHKPKWILVLVVAFPFICEAYAGGWFIGYAGTNDIVFHHDPMLGDGWYTDIGNGYAIDMIDVTDQGTVHPTGGPDRGLNDPKGVSGVRRLQVAGPRIFGSQDLHGFEHLGQNSTEESSFFAIDTRRRQVT